LSALIIRKYVGIIRRRTNSRNKRIRKAPALSQEETLNSLRTRGWGLVIEAAP
jgi:hypothetical protein